MNLSHQSIVKLSQLPVIENLNTLEGLNSCIYVDWYKFKQCSITTCKNWTIKTERKCLALDRVVPNGVKTISDAELHLFKFSRDGISTRLVSLKRKKAVDKVKALIILCSFFEYLKINEDSLKPLAGIFIKSKKLKEQKEAYPLNIKRTGFEIWMWKYLLDETTYNKFAKQREGECKDFNVTNLLHITTERFSSLQTAFKNLQIVKN